MKGALKGLKDKYIEMSAPVKAAFWFTVCSFVQRGISMLTTPIFTRLFPRRSTDFIVHIYRGKRFFYLLLR